MDFGRNSKILFSITAILLLTTNLTLGRTITVGIEDAVGLEYDYEAIQPAINAAHEGDTIIVAEGAYREHLYLDGKNIVLTSTDPNNWDVVQNTIIYTGSITVIVFSGHEDERFILQGFRISNGNGSYGGGICGNKTNATIRNCYISGNSGSYGGGIYKCDGLIDECVIIGNSATSKGGGLYDCDGTINNCLISNNRVTSQNSGEGGALYSCDDQIIKCTIKNNYAGTKGGGLFGCNGTINKCLIKKNEAGNYGGGLCGCNNLITDCIIEENISDISGGGLSNCHADINNCDIKNNTSDESGGGLYGCNGIISECAINGNNCSNKSGGGLARCMGKVENCTIQNNSSPSWHGGGAIDCNSFYNCTITGNSTRGYGGGLYNCDLVSNCTISGNSSEIYPGGGLSDCNSVINCIISGNTAGDNGGGLYKCREIVNCTIVGNYSQGKGAAVYYRGNLGVILNSIIWDNIASEGGQILVETIQPNPSFYNLTVDYSDIQGGRESMVIGENATVQWVRGNNINENPLFVQSGSWNDANQWNEGNYHLTEISPCMDSGDPGRDYADQNDIDGDTRLYGQYVDIGADEYVPPSFVQLELTGPQEVTEGDSALYAALGRFSDDSTQDFTDDVTWLVEPNDIGTINEHGLFTVGALEEATEVTIKATYTPSDQEIIYIAEMAVLCTPLPEPITTYYVDTVNGSNQNDGASRQTAFKTIQAGINAAHSGNTVLVYPGVYTESLIFWGKNITLKSAEDAAVIESPDNIAVLFCFGEGSDYFSQCVIQNFVIRNSEIGILCVAESVPTIKNLTIVNNDYGIEYYSDNYPVTYFARGLFDTKLEISNCIFWNNYESDFVNCVPNYCCIDDQSVLPFIDTTTGNIFSDPLFVDPENGDYHLQSERGRYWPLFDIWVLDNQTSPCIDAGNPEDDYSEEREPNGGIINMGAYGGTLYAGLSPSSELQNKATVPYPDNGATQVNRDVTLSWRAGLNAILHDVYLGTDLEDVRDATRDNPLGILASQAQVSNSYAAETLEYNQTYFWRVDEIDEYDNKTKGDIWAFMTTAGVKGRTCFLPNTPVWVDGEFIPISEVAAGQIAGKSGTSIVEKLQEHVGMYECRDVILESGNCISVVESHLFMLESGMWIASQNLKRGMKLKTMNGSIAIDSVRKREMPYVGKVYNVKVGNSHQYMVGEDAVIVRDY